MEVERSQAFIEVRLSEIITVKEPKLEIIIDQSQVKLSIIK